MLLSGGADHSILATDSATGQIMARLENAHAAGVNIIIPLDESTIASGDDDGCIKVWDVRQRNCTFTFDDVHQDFISDMQHHVPQGSAGPGELIAVSGDGTLSVHSLRHPGKLIAQSDNLEDELLSLAVIKDGKKVVVGSQGGIINIFSYGDWGDINDRFPGHPLSVDSVVMCDRDTVFTGSSDGMIRIVQILPNKLLGVVGEHMDCPIEHLALSPDRRYLASASHDNMIKLWDVAYITQDGESAKHIQAPDSSSQNINADEVSMSEENDSDQEQEKPKKKKKSKKLSAKDHTEGSGSQGGNFFADLM